MAEIFQADYSDNDAGSTKIRTSRKRRSKPSKKTRKKIVSDSESDGNFSAMSRGEMESSESESESDVMEITNEEVYSN